MKLKLPIPMAAAMPVIEHLQQHGYDAVFVGGAVRDTMLRLPIKDVDIATSARPDQVLALFPRSIPTGLQHGTITVLWNGEAYEVTTYRAESAYEGYRKPQSVKYINDLDEDLLRRDFTMNAMAINAEAQLYDPYGGIIDLQRAVLRCVGDADARFQEDALRMLRAIRFIAVYELAPDLATWRALVRHRPLMKHIAMERVQAELDKLLASKRPDRALRWLLASGLLNHLKESILDNEGAVGSCNAPLLRKQCSTVFNKLEELQLIDARWAAIWISSHADTSFAQQAMRRLRFANNRRSFIVDIMKIHGEMNGAVAASSIDQLRLLWIDAVTRYGEGCAKHWLNVARALHPTVHTIPVHMLDELEKELLSMPVHSLKQLHVNGRDLERHLQKKAGPWVSKLLNRLLVLTAAGQLANEKEKLLEQARIWDNEVQHNE